ncbi:MAG: DUF1285 domain-containing protein [Beijerinckiaceae bacterium]|nr:DUF1285 domain-containing protein [Beijerinckiaceae bacterium]
MADVASSEGAGAANGAPGLENLATAARSAQDETGAARTFPPVHLWNPRFCGDIGMKIARDGTWFYQGSPIGRLPMVKLFASILRKDPDRHVLVTPVEMVLVEVEDAPFLAVAMRREEGPEGPQLVFRTNLDDVTRAGQDRPIRFERSAADGVKPYVLVRGDLWALVTRPLFLDLVELGEIRDIDGDRMFGVASGGAFFAMAPAHEIEDLA